MGELIKLRHLLTDCVKPFPKGIGRLSSLRTLNTFVIGGIHDIDGCKLGELKNLNRLKGSLTIKGLKNVTDVREEEGESGDSVLLSIMSRLSYIKTLSRKRQCHLHIIF